MLQDIAGAGLAPGGVAHGAVQAQALPGGVVHAAVQDVVVVEDGVAGPEAHDELAGEARFERVGAALDVRPGAPVRPGHDDEALVAPLAERQVPLRVPLLLLLLRVA